MLHNNTGQHYHLEKQRISNQWKADNGCCFLEKKRTAPFRGGSVILLLILVLY